MAVHKKSEKKQATKPASTPSLAKVTSSLSEDTSNLVEDTPHLADVKSDIVNSKEEEDVSGIVAPPVPEIKTSVEPVGEVISQGSNLETKVLSESEPAADPLSDFKEKMTKEELPVSGKEPKKSYMWPIFFIFIIAIILLAGVYFYKYGININKTSDEANVTAPSPTPTVIPEPTKTVDLTQYEIEILNGSEVDGEAGRQKTALEGEGFTISSVGNADSSDYTDTIIQAKEEVDKDFITKLKSILNSSFTVGETEVLPEDSLVPVIVVIGIEK